MQVNHVNSVVPSILGYGQQSPRPNVTSNSTSTALKQPSGPFSRPLNINQGPIVDRRSNKEVLPENALRLILIWGIIRW